MADPVATTEPVSTGSDHTAEEELTNHRASFRGVPLVGLASEQRAGEKAETEVPTNANEGAHQRQTDGSEPQATETAEPSKVLHHAALLPQPANPHIKHTKRNPELGSFGTGSPRPSPQFRRSSPLRVPPSSACSSLPLEVTRGVWIIWLGVGVSACMASLGMHWVLSHATLWFFGITWGFFNIPLSDFLRSVLFTAASIFFKDFDVAGAHRVPSDSPVLLVCGPHANQFIDPIVVTKALSHRKDVGFLSAASTLRKRIIGDMASAMNAIPVERAQDLAKAGVGTITLTKNSTTVTGVGTNFKTQFAQKKSSLNVKVPIGSSTKGSTEGKALTKQSRSMRVAEVISDTELVLTRPILSVSEGDVDDAGNPLAPDVDVLRDVPFKVFPHIDLADTFAAVHEHLANYNVVGIFPEGGSHDQTKMLPLKVGCAIMALGACALHPGLPLKIIPVGINYFKGHRFRSRVFVDVGEAIMCTPEQIAAFQEGGTKKFAACNNLLQQIKAGLKTVTVESENFRDLQFVRAMRRLYLSGSATITAMDRFSITKAFSECYTRDYDLPAVRKVFDSILEYRQLLDTYRVSDHAVAAAQMASDSGSLDFIPIVNVGRILLWLTIKILSLGVIAVPGLIASLPVTIIIRFVANRKAHAAKKRSSVKVAGRDVMATWKFLVSFVVVPLVHLFYTLGCYFWFGEPAAVAWFFLMPFLALGTIHITEHLKNDLKKIVPLFTSTCAKVNPSGDLVARRLRLQASARSLVNTLEWDKTLKDTRLYRQFSQSPFTWEEDEWDDML